MFHYLYKTIEHQIRNIYLESGLKTLFNVSSNTHDKIITALVQQSIKYDLPSYGELQDLKEISAEKKRSNMLAFILNLVVFAFSILKYCLVPLLHRLIVGKKPRCFIDNGHLRFVFINSAGGVDRLVSIVQENFHKNNYIMFYLFTSFPRKIFERLKRRTGINFISPTTGTARPAPP